MTETSEPRTVVLGLDGAGFDLLDPWVEAGELPALERILDDGVSGDLETVLPPVTSPAWKAYSTGKNPGKIGVFWWQNVDTENRRVYLPTERYHENTEFWEIIAEREPVGVLGMPTTYPPKSVDSFVVAGPPDADDRGFTHPPSLEDDLRERFDYRIAKRYRLTEGSEEAYEEVLELIDQRFAAAKHLAERYDVSFLQVTTFYINALHHHLWDHEYTLRGWKIIDDHLAEFLDGDTNVVLMADHGHEEIQSVFRINRWLIEEGYLSFDTAVANSLNRLGINTDRLQGILGRVDRALPALDVRRLADRYAPQRVLNHIPNERGEIGSSKHSRTNWDETDAIASAQGPVYLTADPGTERYERLREELIDRLESLTDPEGRPVAEAVHRGEEVYSGPYLDEAPDLVVEQASGSYIAEYIGQRDVFAEEDDRWRGINDRHGLFAAHGPAFTSGTVGDLSILDLAPTLLHLHGRPVPGDMDGRVRTEVFADRTGPATRDVEPRD